MNKLEHKTITGSLHEGRQHSCGQITNNLEFPVFALYWRLNTLEMQWCSG